MSRVLTFFSALLTWMRELHAARDAEILFLRPQLLVLRRAAPARLIVRNTDRFVVPTIGFKLLYGLTILNLGRPSSPRRSDGVNDRGNR
jgi:hypothetical protein